MQVKSTFFVGLSGISLPLAAAPGLQLRDGLRAITDRASIARLIGSYEDSIGLVEKSFLESHAPAVAFRNTHIDIDPVHAGEWVNGALVRSLVNVHLWLMGLWLVKDNAVDADLGWMAAKIDGVPIVNNNRWSTATSKADGTASYTAFTAQELRESVGFPLVLSHWSEAGPVSLDLARSGDPDLTKLSAGSLRFQRFLYFITAARTTKDVAFKVAHWCSGLEALVSSSHSELSHQVAERVASALNPPGLARLETFRLVKRAYGLRSKAVHGAAFKAADLPMLVDTSVAIDAICRSLARLYFSDEAFSSAIEGDNESFNNFWLDRLLVG
jgi:hypothetical protein